MTSQRTAVRQLFREQPMSHKQAASGEQVGVNADGSRLHLHYGPIDLVLSADGPDHARQRAFDAAVRRFDGLLDELVEELSALRRSIQSQPPVLSGSVAKRMLTAVWPYRNQVHVTPMAAVAGAVADEIGAAIAGSDTSRSDGIPELTRWMVNNGGDIAIWLTQGKSYRVGVVMNHDQALGADTQPTVATGNNIHSMAGTITVDSEMRSGPVVGLGSGARPIGGIATSGQQGRSFSLGIADSVTVLAANAAAADVAATLIANRVDLPEHPGIVRTPACELDPDSDLGQRLVTTLVPRLSEAEAKEALNTGLGYANQLVAKGLIAAATLHLSGITIATAGPVSISIASDQQVEAHYPGAASADA